MRLEDMPNIGKTLARDLRAVGIESPDQLKALGSIEAIKRMGLVEQTCSSKLYALEGAILGLRWHELDQSYREALYQRMKDETHIRNKK